MKFKIFLLFYFLLFILNSVIDCYAINSKTNIDYDQDNFKSKIIPLLYSIDDFSRAQDSKKSSLNTKNNVAIDYNIPYKNIDFGRPIPGEYKPSLNDYLPYSNTNNNQNKYLSSYLNSNLNYDYFNPDSFYNYEWIDESNQIETTTLRNDYKLDDIIQPLINYFGKSSMGEESQNIYLENFPIQNKKYPETTKSTTLNAIITSTHLNQENNSTYTSELNTTLDHVQIKNSYSTVFNNITTFKHNETTQFMKTANNHTTSIHKNSTVDLKTKESSRKNETQAFNDSKDSKSFLNNQGFDDLYDIDVLPSHHPALIAKSNDLHFAEKRLYKSEDIKATKNGW